MPRRAAVARRRGDAGSAAIEMAVIAPVFLLLVFAGLQIGLWAYGRSVALAAAREGVSQLRVLPEQHDGDAARSQVATNVVSFATAVGRESLLHPIVSTRRYTATGGQDRVEVVVRGSVISLVPGLRLQTSQRATGSVERFAGVR